MRPASRQLRVASRQQPATVELISLGCAKNRVDSEIMLHSIMHAGMELAHTPEQADIILVNTCAFIGDAKRESLDVVLDAIARKNNGQCKAVVVAGCLPQRYRRELQRELPEVDAFIGLDNVPQLGRILKRLTLRSAPIYKVGTQANAVLDPPADRPILANGPYAFIRLADGCNHRCAFCAIPLIRGQHRSRKPDSVVRECEALLERGIRELNLISQDVLAYGRDRAGRSLLPGLLRRLNKLGGKFWIRLLYGHPESLKDELLDAMAECAKTCRYLDLPIQHAHPDILRAMGRRGNPQYMHNLFKHIRQRLPGVTLRTTCLVGFPGETEEHFQALLDLIRSVRFDHLGVFSYSREEGTSAAKLPDRIPEATIRRRQLEILAAQRSVVDAYAASLKNQNFEALLQYPLNIKRQTWIARTARQAPEVDGVTHVSGVKKTHDAGSFIRINITGQQGCDFKAVAKT